MNDQIATESDGNNSEFTWPSSKTEEEVPTNELAKCTDEPERNDKRIYARWYKTHKELAKPACIQLAEEKDVEEVCTTEAAVPGKITEEKNERTKVSVPCQGQVFLQ